ncbi:F-box domain-containing protein [Heracleum sosnowskyi]|uniref:F-box domain-containing protein n=1 Tax=Heracleum sosnowskyi TaxID=360622 RepID=A0AAD8MFT1_9APIA|nr:F-box domain-containing protein [Heracleum sosnowskyi]
MRSSKHKKMPSYNFPEDVFAEILKRLPVKYVLRCGSVQKSWYNLIKTPIFITLHTNHHKLLATRDSNNHPKYLFFLNMRDHLLTVRFDDVQCQEYGTLKYPLDLPNHAWYALANGLVCVSSMFVDGDSRYYFNQHRNVLSHGPVPVSSLFNRTLHYDPSIHLWNPLVGKFRTLPDSPCMSFTSRETRCKGLAFGFLPEVNDYVVVHIVKPWSTYRSEADSHSVMIGVYSLNTNSWKKICQDNVFIHRISSNDAVFVNGAAFWTGTRSLERYEPIVMCFDTKTDILREIRFPDWVEFWHSFPVRPFGQSIAFFSEGGDRNYLNMWVLKDDDPINEFYWENKMRGTLSENVRGKVLGVRNNGEPILSKFSNLISYNLDKSKEYDFADSCDHRTPFSYYDEGCKPPLVITPFVETLVFLDIN